MLGEYSGRPRMAATVKPDKAAKIACMGDSVVRRPYFLACEAVMGVVIEKLADRIDKIH